MVLIEKEQHMYLVKKTMKNFLTLCCISNFSNEDVIVAVCFRNPPIEAVPVETRHKYERENSYVLKPLDYFNLPNDCWF